MIANLPGYISFIFGLTAVGTVFLFYRAVKNAASEATRKTANPILAGLLIWLAVQAVLTVSNVYKSSPSSIPPKIVLFGILPTIVTIIFLFITKKGRYFISSLPLINLTYLNIVRIPVEFILVCLYLNKAVPQLMTFEGRNFDILSGITAPLIAYYGFTKRTLGRSVILVWNFLCLALLLNIVVNALLSAPSPLQTLAFNQPNIAIVNFPFSWLPTCIVPIVLFGHLVSITQLIKPQPA